MNILVKKVAQRRKMTKVSETGLIILFNCVKMLGANSKKDAYSVTLP